MIDRILRRAERAGLDDLPEPRPLLRAEDVREVVPDLRGVHATQLGDGLERAGDERRMLAQVGNLEVFGNAHEQRENIEVIIQTVERLADVRKAGVVPYLRPDGKSQVTVEYERGVPKQVRTVVVSSQQDPATEDRIRDDIIESVILPVIPRALRPVDPVMHVNPTGRFVTGGPMVVNDRSGGARPHRPTGAASQRADKRRDYGPVVVNGQAVASKEVPADNKEHDIGFAGSYRRHREHARAGGRTLGFANPPW